MVSRCKYSHFHKIYSGQSINVLIEFSIDMCNPKVHIAFEDLPYVFENHSHQISEHASTPAKMSYFQRVSL